MYSPSTIKTYKRIDLNESKSLVSDKGFSSEKLRLIIKAQSPAEVDRTANELANFFRKHDLRIKGPIHLKKYRGRLEVRNPRTGSVDREINGCLIHSRELRVYEVTQIAMNELIQFQPPLTVQIEVRKGLMNVERPTKQ